MKRIIFFCPASHHLIHILPVIKLINAQINAKIYIVTKAKINMEGVKFYTRLRQLPIRIYDLYIATEIALPPPWVIAKKIFLGHGVGPKMGYQSNSKIRTFDYSFAPCKPIYDEHKKLGITVIKSGLPILDKFMNEKKGIKDFLDKIKIDNRYKTLIYLPSWSNDHEVLENIKPTIIKLSHWKNLNIIVSPHPNLLKPEKCQGLSLLDDIPSNITLNKTISSLELIPYADFIIGDISSSIFEAMAMKKIVIWDGDEKNYIANKAEFLISEMKAICPNVDSVIISKDLSFYRKKQEEFIQNYIFNIGSSTQVIFDEIKKILK